MDKKLIFLFIVLSLAACSVAPTLPLETETPTQSVLESGAGATQTAPTLMPLIPTATQIPTATPEPTVLKATVWTEDPQIPILNYHRFIPDHMQETGMKIRISTFKAHLEQLYAAGYSLISLDDLLAGSLVVPEGRRPLVISMDDAYFADQIYLDQDGLPSEQCGVGVLYAFSQAHPEFGFAVALFANFGDKYYGNEYRNGWWYLGDNWQEDLAKTIVWGIEHNVMPYNHLYRHPKLDITEEKDILPQAYLNDEALRNYLALAERSDLVDQISNYIALPYGIWPATQRGKDLLLGYTDPEGKPVRAVFEAGYEYSPAYALAPFAEGFDPFHIPRMAGISPSITAIISAAETFPVASNCDLEIPGGLAISDVGVIESAIFDAVKAERCAEGVYILETGIYQAQEGLVIQLEMQP